MMLRQKIIINGKRISSTKLEAILQEGLDNVILTGFFSLEDLEKAVSVNGYYSDYLIDKILDKLYNTYTDALHFNRSNASVDIRAAAANITVIARKIEIILDLMIKRSQYNLEPIDDESDYLDDSYQDDNDVNIDSDYNNENFGGYYTDQSEVSKKELEEPIYSMPVNNIFKAL